MALPANRRQLFRQWVWLRRWHLAACVVAAAVIVSLFLLTHLDEAPVTGRTRLLVFNRQNYIDLAAVTSEMVRKERGTVGKNTRAQMCLTAQTKYYFEATNGIKLGGEKCLSRLIFSTCWSLRSCSFPSMTLVTRWWKSWCSTCHKETRTSLKCLRSPGKSMWWKVRSSMPSVCRSVIDLQM